MKKITYVLTLFFVLLLSFSVHAQDILKSKDLSTIKVDYLSQDDLFKISAQLKSNNMTIDQVEPMAISKGMSQEEFNKLKIKLNNMSTSTVTTNSSNNTDKDKTDLGLSLIHISEPTRPY